MDMATPITQRFVPQVTGIDLEQSLNHVDSDGLDLKWFYTSFTYPKTFYRRGSRSDLEKYIREALDSRLDDMQKLQHCLVALDRQVKHYCVLGFEGSRICGTSEEKILEAGRGWCNEQARILVAFTQIAGMPSRLVFADKGIKLSHVLSEVYANNKWVLIDQTLNYIFRKRNGTPVNILDFKKNRTVWNEADALYKAQLLQNREQVADKACWDHIVPYGTIPHPLDLFTHVGYCNYFIH